MWSRLKKQIAVEEAEIVENLAFHRELLDNAQERALVGIELSAAAAFLHSFYSGIENSFRRIAIELDGGMAKSSDWHQRLLEGMTQATERRPRVVSDELQERLKEYLQFRHLFRNIYAFRLEWARMEALVLGADQLMADLKKELAVFVQEMDERLAADEGRAAERPHPEGLTT